MFSTKAVILKSTVSNDLKIKDLIQSFSDVDTKNHFSFTSGHLGTLPVSDDVLMKFIINKGFFESLKKITLVLRELIKLIIFFFLPVKNIAILLRTILRYFCNPKPIASHSLTVISLGIQSSSKDAYFGPLLTQLDNKFDYLKIVGGYSFRSKNYFYVESALSFFEVVKFSIYILFSPLLSLGYLLSKVIKLDRLDYKEIFFLLGLKEINSGIITQNNLIAISIKAWLNKNKTNKILYPMEGRSWEKNIVKCMNESSVQSVGYIHCVLTPRHLSLVMPGFYRQKEIPSIIVAPSQMIARLVRVTFPNAIVKKGYFLRGDENNKTNPKKKNPNCLLFALTGNIAESTRIIDCIIALGIQKKYQIILRLNPNTSSYKYLIGYAEKFGINLYSNSMEYLPSICFFRSSSVALDYLKLNVTPVYLSLGEIISSNVFDLDKKYGFEILEMNELFGVNLNNLVKLNNEVALGEQMSQYYLEKINSNSTLSDLLD
ncbi:MAG: hypothetical protein WA123_03860 [Methylotenera sp.]